MGVSIYIFWNLIVLPKYLIIYLRGTKIYFSLYLNRVKFRYSIQVLVFKCCSLKILRVYKEQHFKYMYLSFVYLNNNVEKIELSKEINNLFFFFGQNIMLNSWSLNISSLKFEKWAILITLATSINLFAYVWCSPNRKKPQKLHQNRPQNGITTPHRTLSIF